jgi:hypothetical protein
MKRRIENVFTQWKNALKFTGNQYGLDRKKKVYNYPLYLVSGFNMHLMKSVI